MKFGHNTRDSTLPYSGNPESLSHLGLVRYRVVTDSRTDRRTDGRTIAGTHLALRAVAHKNTPLHEALYAASVTTCEWAIHHDEYRFALPTIILALCPPVMMYKLCRFDLRHDGARISVPHRPHGEVALKQQSTTCTSLLDLHVGL